MTACYIHRIRADHSVVLQPALTTSTPGIYLARVVLSSDSRASASATAWQLRLHCGHALGDYGYPLPAARRLAAQLGDLDVDWRSDDHTLSVRFHANPDLHRRARAILAQPATAAVPVRPQHRGAA